MRTTIYIESGYWEKLIIASETVNLTVHDMIGILVSRITVDAEFDAQPFTTVTYQESDPDKTWCIKHVRFEPVFYEKCQDLRRHFKFSVSWFISYAIDKYLDRIVEKLKKPKNRRNIRDNYDRNYVYIAQNYGTLPGFLTIWGMPAEKYRDKLLVT